LKNIHYKLINIILLILTTLIIACVGNDFHYDGNTRAIVSNHDGFKHLSVEIESSTNKYIAGCELPFVSDSLYIKPMQHNGEDSNCYKAFDIPNTIMTIRNSGGDAGSYSIKLLIDSNRNIKQIIN
jgi:hypothetical protein